MVYPKGDRTSFSHVPGKTQDGHKPVKHGKPEKLREFEKLSKSQGKLKRNLNFCWKNPENSGK